MTQEHLIRPPHELVQQWVSLACENEGYETWQDLATEAARWGADMELEACCEWLKTIAMTKPWDTVAQLALELRDTRRPKPPSLKEQALQALDLLKVDASTHGLGFDSSAIRRALESLPD